MTASGGGGLTRGQARNRRYLAPSRGLRLTPELADDPVAVAVLVQQASPQGSVLSDITAAQAERLPLPPWLGLDAVATSIAVRPGQSRSARTGVRGRRILLPEDHLYERDGLTLTIPARTWLDCSAELPLPYVVAMADNIVNRALADLAALEGMVRWGRGRRGVATARRSLPLIDGAAVSPGESLTRVALVRGGIPRPECNAHVFDDGQWLACCDMVWRQEMVIVEYDGIVHLPEEQRRKDALRRNLLTEAGWTVLVFTAADLKNPRRMCQLVHAALTRREPYRLAACG